MWMTLLQIVAIAVVVVIVAVAAFYAVLFLTTAMAFFTGVRAVGKAVSKTEPEVDLAQQIRMQTMIDKHEDRKRKRGKSIDKEEDRQIQRRRKLRFWDRIYRDGEGLSEPSPEAATPALPVRVQKPKRIANKPPEQNSGDGS